MRTRGRVGMLAFGTVAALAALSPVRAAGPAATLIDTAATAVRADDHAARSTESVRYDDTALTLLASYRATDGELAAMPTTSARERALWGLVQATLPDDAVASIKQMNVVTDGPSSTLAMVHRSSVDADAWVLSIDPAETDDVLVSTLVHEYAHMLTLGTDELASNAASKNGCDGVRIAIGCAHAGSTLAAWHDEFWPSTAEPAAHDAKVFVSDYAATSVHEDLAESFMSWTLGDIARPSAAVQARYDFFAARPIFVASRDAVQAKLADASLSRR